MPRSRNTVSKLMSHYRVFDGWRYPEAQPGRKKDGSEIESQPNGGRRGNAVVSEERKLLGRGIDAQTRKSTVVVIGGIQQLAVEAQLPFSKQPGLVGSQIETLVGSDSYDWRWESVDGKSGAIEAFHAETNGRLEAIAGKEIDGVPLVRERWRIGCVLAERAERRSQRDFVRSGSREDQSVTEPSRKPILTTALQHELQAAGVISAKESRLFERRRGKKKDVFALLILPVERLGAKARTFSESLLNC